MVPLKLMINCFPLSMGAFCQLHLPESFKSIFGVMIRLKTLTENSVFFTILQSNKGVFFVLSLILFLQNLVSLITRLLSRIAIFKRRFMLSH